jgi:hypothetical protein
VGYIVALSALVLGLQRVYRTEAAKSLRARVFGPEEEALNANYVPEGGYVARHGGTVGLSCQLARFVTNIARTALALVTYLSDGTAGSMCVIGAGVSRVIAARRSLS